MIERRSEVRFPLVARVRYKLCDHGPEGAAGIGQTVSVSSSGMLLKVQHVLNVGDRVAVTVDLLEHSEIGRADLTLVGQVVRVEPGRIALQFEEQDVKRAAHLA